MKRTLLSTAVFVLPLISFGAFAPCFSQGPPTPGNGDAPSPGASSYSIPTPGPGIAAPVPGPSAQQVLSGGGTAAYRRLPLNHQNAAIRLEELRNIMLTAKPKEFQDAVTDYLDWLSDMADAHWKIYQAFLKVDSLKLQADVEKQATLKLGQLKRQAMLLKAEFLIRQNRQPEALQPLVDIVVAEPRTATGEAAYALLKQIGFTEEAPLNPSANVASPAGAVTTAKPIALSPAPASAIVVNKVPSYSIVPAGKVLPSAKIQVAGRDSTTR